MRLQMRQVRWMTVVLACVVMTTGADAAQPPAAPTPATQQKVEVPVVPLKVTVVITRHKADKAQTVLSRLPFELWVNSGSEGTMRISSDLPVPTTVISQDEATKKSTPVMSYSLRPIGTSLTVNARNLGDGRFQVNVSLSDSQIIPLPTEPVVGVPRTASQSMQTTTAPILRDGQTVQHSLVTDRTTGDITKVEVTLNVVK